MSSFGDKRVNEQIETARLLIRPLDAADAVALHDAVVESKHSLAAWLDWCNDSYDLDDAANWITESTLPTTLDHSRNFGIFLRVGSPALVGCAGLSAIDPKASVANLGYWIRTSMQRRGFAKEAAAVLEKWKLRPDGIKPGELNPLVKEVLLKGPLGGKADHLAQQIGIRRLLNKRPQVHRIVGHRSSFRFWVGVSNQTLTGKRR